MLKLGEQFKEPLVIGVAMSLRVKERLMEIWLKDGRNESLRFKVYRKIKEILKIDFTSVMIYYKDHQKSIQVD